MSTGNFPIRGVVYIDVKREGLFFALVRRLGALIIRIGALVSCLGYRQVEINPYKSIWQAIRDKKI